jgi:proline iminopeptidase
MKLAKVLGLVAAFAVLFLLAYLFLERQAEVPRTVADDPALPRVELDGVAFHSEVFGEPTDPVVIVLHGGPGGDYRSLRGLRSLADHSYQVVFYDQLGAGLSPRVPAEDLTLQGAIEDLDGFVNHFGKGGPVALVGHSWGGILASYYVARNPEKVAGAVLAEPGVLTSEELSDFMAKMQATPSVSQLLFLGRVLVESLHVDGPDDQARMDYIFGRMMAAPGDSPLREYWCDGVPPPAVRDTWRFGALAMQTIMQEGEMPDGTFTMPPLDGIERYRGDILILASSCNTLIGVERQKAHLALFPNARLELVENSGHMMFSEQPEVSSQIVLDYLASRGPSDERPREVP